MSEVNVLAVMDAAIDNLQRAGYIGNTIGMRKSRDAVIRLIEAAIPFATFNGSEATQTIYVRSAEIRRLRNALSAVGGSL